jgi:hypothetical protein
MAEWLMNMTDMEGSWRGLFILLSLNLPGGVEKSYEKPSSE